MEKIVEILSEVFDNIFNLIGIDLYESLSEDVFGEDEFDNIDFNEEDFNDFIDDNFIIDNDGDLCTIEE